MKLGIACASGSYKGVFVHGVLDAFEEAGLRADVYSSASSSTVCAAMAAAGRVRSLPGPIHWRRAWELYVQADHDISAAVLDGIREAQPLVSSALFSPGASRFAVAVSAVITEEAAGITQGPGARRLGQQLVLATRTHDGSWADAHLRGILFDTAGSDARFRLRPENLADVAYATTRMLHAWKTPAWIEGEPYVDASYTCSCPAIPLIDMGCRELIVVAPEAGPIYTDFFQRHRLPDSYRDVRLRVVQPERNLSEIGVDYLKVTPEGLSAAFEEGRRSAAAFLERDRPAVFP